jgi:phosphate transport system permease protein
MFGSAIANEREKLADSGQHEPEITDPQDDVPRRIGALRVSDVLSMVGAILASLSMTTFIFTVLAPIGGVIGFLVIAYILFLITYAALVALDEKLTIVRARVVSVAVHSLAVIVFATLVYIVAYSVFRGAEALPYLNFFIEDMSYTGPLDPVTQGGVIHAIVGSLIQIGIALAITIPLGLATAVFLSEVPGPFSRFLRTIVEAMTALPSIVAGLFIYATFILILGFDKSGFAASLAITVMMLPIMIRASDVVLRLVPSTLKEASIGLGADNFRTMWQVTLPTARSGLVTAIILATARGIGETSPVLLTSGFTASFNANPFEGPMVSLPLAVFQFVKSPEPTMIARGFGTAAVLMLLVVILFVIARIIGSDTVAKKEKRRSTRQRIIRQLGFFFRSLASATVRLVRWVSVEIAFRNRRGKARRRLTETKTFDAVSNNEGVNER